MIQSQSALPFKLKKGVPSYLKTECMKPVQDKVELTHGEWQNKLMNYLIEFVEEWDIRRTLELVGNSEPKIPLDISHVYFPHLKQLSLWFNKIQSVEGMAFLRAPSLQLLHLGNNEIVRIKPLRKLNAKVQWVQLYNNFISDSEYLVELVTHENMFGYVLQDYGSEEFSQDLRWSLKLSTKKMKKLFINSETRIYDRALIHSLRSRYPKITLFLPPPP